MAIVALPAFAALREHGTRFSKALSWMFLAWNHRANQGVTVELLSTVSLMTSLTTVVPIPGRQPARHSMIHR
jgi:hypothetical protein